MTKTVYFSHCSPPDLYNQDYMLVKEPDSLYKDLLKDKNFANNYNNYMDCPGFLKSIQNTFIIRNSFTTDLKINLQTGDFFNIDGQQNQVTEHFTAKPICRKLPLFNIYHNILFFCEEDLEITTIPAYMHNSELQSKCTYIPGSFNISRWFRPVEGAFEMKHAFTELTLKDNDPMYYVKFNTTESVKFVRFYLSLELWQMSQGCVNYKKYHSMKPLKYLYKVFSTTFMRKLVSKNIKQNLIL